MTSPPFLPLNCLAGISVSSKCVISDLAVVSAPGVVVVVIGVSFAANRFLWDFRCGAVCLC